MRPLRGLGVLTLIVSDKPTNPVHEDIEIDVVDLPLALPGCCKRVGPLRSEKERRL
jgi:hypothetical protein